MPGRSLPVSLLVSLRPEQWTKNSLVFAGLMFGYAERYHAVDQLQIGPALVRSLAAFAIFCALSSVVYLLNDVADRDGDRQHPLKCRRPIACGDLPVGTALIAAAVLAAAGLSAGFALSPSFGIVALAYVSLVTLYSMRLKHVVILDVLTLSIGFVLRAVAGAVVIDVAISHWLLVCTILLALFIALSKRRHELVLLADRAAGHRRILGEYSPYLLDQMISVVTASTLIAYIFYTISPETEQKFQTHWLGLTIPFPLYGIFRYLYLVHQKEGGGSPTTMLMNDRPLLACVALWAIAVAVIIYWPFGF
ncbi:MAG: decaprenyl-phosphate phosphoribosyltransferase [Bacteroidales bacterium]